MQSNKGVSEPVNVKAAITAKLNEYLSECGIDELRGDTFSGEAWAYKRVLSFIDKLPA